MRRVCWNGVARADKNGADALSGMAKNRGETRLKVNKKLKKYTKIKEEKKKVIQRTQI